MYINQDLKWDKEYLKTLNDENFKQIFDALLTRAIL